MIEIIAWDRKGLAARAVAAIAAFVGLAPVGAYAQVKAIVYVPNA